MKKFSFRLEKVLKMRAWSEGEARNNLGRAVGELSSIEQAIAENVLARGAAAAERWTEFNTLNMMRYENYLKRLDDEKDDLKTKAAEAELKVEASRTAWMQAKADLKTLETLKDRRHHEYRQELLADEEKQISEIRGSATAY
ncbi:MAG: flagellar export protein FliJ [Spirochaetaceae bacterium]|jgi:flagellar FliJ protein|nr:flagellar export protein FliJ [Spirochaetaceae bacterium]